MALGTDTPAWPHVARVMVISLVYANCVGTITSLALPSLVRRYGPGRGVAELAVRVTGLLITIPAGLVLAAVILLVVGVIGPGDFLRHALPTDWPVYVYPTMLLITWVSVTT
jgi:hypothetical protein